jgi:hypothetical protein
MSDKVRTFTDGILRIVRVRTFHAAKHSIAGSGGSNSNGGNTGGSQGTGKSGSANSSGSTWVRSDSSCLSGPKGGGFYVGATIGGETRCATKSTSGKK